MSEHHVDTSSETLMYPAGRLTAKGAEHVQGKLMETKLAHVRPVVEPPAARRVGSHVGIDGSIECTSRAASH